MPEARQRKDRRRSASLALICLAAVAAVAAAAAIAAWAIWSAGSSATSHGAAVAASVNQGATPTATASAGRTVTVNWGASTLSNGTAVDGYVVTRYDASSGSAQTTLAGCSGTISATSCTEVGVPAGQWKYTVTPVIATNWRGAEGLKSGAATIGAATLTLNKTLFGAPLPQNTTGSLAGFAAFEGVAYRLDAATTMTGSPSSVGAVGTATISSLTIPTTADGSHTVYALGNATPFPSQASAGIVTDTTPPTPSAQLTPAANASGWNNVTPVSVALSATDGTGSGVAQITYTTDGTDPTTSGSAIAYAAAISVATNATVKYFATDNAGNASSVQSQVVRIDLLAPANALQLSGVSGGAFLSGGTLFYRGSDAGSFTLTNTLTDAGGSGPASSGTAALAGTSAGFVHTSSLVATPAGGPYVSSAFSWSAGTSSSPTESVTGSDVAGNTATTVLTLTPDTAGPVSGALTVNGVAASGGGSSSGSATGSFSIGRTDYSDAGSGIVSSVLTVQTGALGSAGGIAAGTCSAFGSAATLTGTPAQTVIGPHCYLYTLTGTDQVGNTSSISTTVIVDTTGPSAPSVSLSAATGSTFVVGSTVFVNAQAGKSGGFQVAATTTDADSGIQKVAFPALSGFSSGGGDDTTSPFQTTYAWSGAVGASGAQTVTATNTATGAAASTFTVTPDTAGPVSGALTVNGVAGSGGGGSVSTSVTGSYTIARTDYNADAGSGLSSSVLTLQTGTFSSSDGVAGGTCSAYVPTATLTGSPAQTVTGSHCYLYTLTGTDQVGNTSVISTTVKVDTTPPSTPTLALTAGSGAYVLGSTVTVNPKSGTSFQVAAATSDSDSGIQKVNFPVLTGFSGAGDVAVSPFQTTYSWTGAGSASGAQTVTASNSFANTATSSFTVTPDSTKPTLSSIVSRQSGGAAGNGKLEVGDTLTLTFSEELLPSSVGVDPTTLAGTFSGYESRALGVGCVVAPNATLSITGVTNGPVDAGDCSYLSGLLCVGTCVANFTGTSLLTESGSSTTLVLTIGTVSGATVGSGSGALVFAPAATIADRVGNGGIATVTTAGNFKLF